MSAHGADVVVVGAGPAGAASALLLARAGWDVLLLERAFFPRPKPCGDCLSAGAGAVLRRLGVLGEVEAAAPARLGSWRIHAPGGHCFEGAFGSAGGAGTTGGAPGAALALPRERLDNVLANASVRAGARLVQGARVLDIQPAAGGRGAAVSVRDVDGQLSILHPALVVGADGLRSVVARRLGLIRREPRLRKLSLTAHARGIHWDDRPGPGGGAGRGAEAHMPAAVGGGARAHGEMHVIEGACVGLAPVGAGRDPLCNLSLVVDARRFRIHVSRDALGFFRAMLTRFPALRERVAGLRLVPHGAGRPLLASGPFDWSTRAVIGPGVALVGDAAGYYDPFTGQGIYQALICAEILAQEADRALRERSRPQPLLLRDYARRRREVLRGARALQRVIEAVVSRPWLADAVLARLRRSRPAADALVAVTGDLRQAGTLLDPRLLLSLLAPRFAWTEAA